MSDNILKSIKTDLGIGNCDSFDEEITMHINTSIFTLYQIGANPVRLSIEGEDDTWLDIFKDDLDILEMIKQYIFLNVKMIFDPPSSSFVLESMSKNLAEIEWRINLEVEDGRYCEKKKFKKKRLFESEE